MLPAALASLRQTQLWRIEHLVHWLREGRSFTRRSAARAFQVSIRTVADDIERLRYLGVPVDYDAKRNTYYLTEPFDHLPFVSIRRREWPAFLVARFALDALGDTPDGEVSEAAAIAIVDGPEISPEEKAGYEGHSAEQPSGPQGGRSAFQQGKGRITYEFAIPLASLEKAAGAKTAFIQVNAGINDYDEADARLGISFLTWRPTWRGTTHANGLGIFRLE